MTQPGQPLDIPAPDPDFYPRKANMFEGLITANSQLGPLFPFTHPGAIFALLTWQRGDQRPAGIFEHKNNCDEFIICMGSNVGFARPGQVFIAPHDHDVVPINTGSADDYMFAYYLQRQPLEENQHESVRFKCEKCGEGLYTLEFSGSKVSDYKTASDRILIPTVVGSDKASEYFNEHDEVRHCSNCGHDNPKFPRENWGWMNYVINAGIAEKSELAIAELTA